MRMTLQRASLHIVALATLLFAADIARAQDDAQKLRIPATVRGVIGGESHDSYVVRARAGQIMTVQISWRREHDEEWVDINGNNFAQFWIGELSDYGADPVEFGKESNKGKRWSGKIPRTGNYYIYVTGFPIARYTLRVTVK